MQYHILRSQRASHWCLLFLVVLLMLSLTGGVEAACKRSGAVRRAFVRTHPCPSTGLTRLPCHGFILDHIWPLCAGGADSVQNMQWQSIEDAKKKDREERAACTACRLQGKSLCAS